MKTTIKKMWRLGTLYLVTLNLLLGVTPAGAAQSLNFRSIDIHLPGVTLTVAHGINAKRDIVGRYAVGASVHGFLLTNGTLTTIDHPNGIGTTFAQGISPTGDLVGHYGDQFSTTQPQHAFVRHPDGTFSPIDFPDELLPPSAPRPNSTLAIKITPTGRVVGCFHHLFSDFPTTMHGYVFQDGHFDPPFPLLGSMHNGITPDGRMIAGVVFQNSMTQSHAYLVSDGVTQIIDPQGSISADARDINSSGEIVGFFTDPANRTHGFLLNKDGYTVIDFPGNDVVATQALGINPQGDIVGRYTDSRGVHGFVAIRSQGQGNSLIIPTR